MASQEVKGAPAEESTFYTRLIIDKARRRLISIAVVIGFFAFCVLINQEISHPNPSAWMPGLPIVILGLIVTAVPMSEKWEYKPWQARARQYERNQ
ncbi:MAG: hypothetical protein FJ146_07850 [Deltaproteobacteria bacterium]|nr:hypothetical protein [Deltaproteobacteria bacterium]